MPETAAMAPTVGEALAAAALRLRRAAVGEPRRDAAILLAEVLRVDRSQLWGRDERRLTPSEVDRFDVLVDGRAARMPVSRILGRREFWSLSFTVGPDVLDPRPDSETLVQAVLQDGAGDRGALRLLDLGTGSGCLLLSLLSELPEATGVGVDISPAALAMARCNARAHELAPRAQFIAGDWAQALTGRFDLIVANPPYLRSAELTEVEPEVRDYEPVLALDGGDDGLSAYRAIAPDLSRLLNRDGRAYLECGAGQAADVEQLLAKGGLTAITRHCDLAGHARCVAASAA